MLKLSKCFAAIVCDAVLHFNEGINSSLIFPKGTSCCFFLSYCCIKMHIFTGTHLCYSILTMYTQNEFTNIRLFDGILF